MIRKREKYLYLFVLWVVGTFIVMSIPRMPLLSGIAHYDKAGHFIIYGVSGLLFSCYLREGNLRREMIFIYTVLVISLIGGIDEMHQRWVAWRVPSLFDFMADISGGIFGSALVIVADRLKFFTPTVNNE